MLRPATLWIALRYLRAQRASQFSSLVALASVIGVALGVAALIVVLSVMNGFEDELRSRLVAITGHATILTGRQEPAWQAILTDVEKAPGVVSAMPYIELEGMLSAGNELAGVIVEGIDLSRKTPIAGLDGALRSGTLSDLTPGSWHAVLGRSLANRLNVSPGDTVRLLIPARDKAGSLRSRLRELTVTGVFEVGVRDHDAVRLLVSLADAAAMAGLEGRVTGIRIQTDDIFTTPRVLDRWLAAWTAAGHAQPRTRTWTQDNATYFRAVRIEKTMMTLLLSLIVAVAAFNIVATLVMVVTDKRAGIAILRTIGFSRVDVVSVFAMQGLMIGWIGVLAGVLGGALLASNIGEITPALERLFGFQFMPADVYYLTSLPAHLKAGDLIWVSVIALAMTAFATIYPALRAAAVAPAEVLRYE
ncbi:MAG: lipoprotein-releasing ABC transporter permease subunit [Gammaproteobacteria bacterium]